MSLEDPSILGQTNLSGATYATHAVARCCTVFRGRSGHMSKKGCRTAPAVYAVLHCFAHFLSLTLHRFIICGACAVVPRWSRCHERCTAAARCTGSALKTRCLLICPNTEDFRHQCLRRAAKARHHQFQASAWMGARPRPYIGASTPAR